MTEQDKFCTDLIAKSETTILTKESKPAQIFAGENDPDESAKLIDLLFDFGVQEIIAVDAESEGDMIGLGKAVLKLPEEQASRAKIFEWNQSHAEMLGFDGDTDEGQSYLFVMFD